MCLTLEKIKVDLSVLYHAQSFPRTCRHDHLTFILVEHCMKCSLLMAKELNHCADRTSYIIPQKKAPVKVPFS